VYSNLVGNDAPLPFWSADSRFVVFQSDGKLRKVDAAGGPPQTICDTSLGYTGGAWSPEGVIVFAARPGLMRVSAAGGDPSPLTKLDPSRQETFHTGPALLPDGRHFLYLRRSNRDQSNGIYVGSLDATPEQQDTRRLLPADFPAIYAPSPNGSIGHVLFLRENTLMARPFDAASLALAAEAVPVAESVTTSFGRGMFEASATGVLAYGTGAGLGTPTTQLTWFDRAGKILETVGEPGQYNTVALSPDGTRVAVSRNGPQDARTAGPERGGNGNVDIWLHEFSRGTNARFTYDPGMDWMAVWSPDGSHIIFASNRDGSMNLYQKVSSGAGNEEALLQSNDTKFPYDWSEDGRFLLYAVVVGRKYSLWVLPLTGDDRKPMPYLQTESNASQARFSADSRWIAYTSNESGKQEIYVRPFPAASGGKWIVSKGGGNQPHWRRDGKELYYLSADSKLMSVEVATTSGTFQAGIPKALFAAPISGGGTNVNVTRYDVTADGKKFLINALPTETTLARSTPITVVLNWQAGLKK
jgi:Tol biopolymer transport system component